MINAALASKLDKASAVQITMVLRTRFGQEYHATARKGEKMIAKTSGLGYTAVYASSWTEAMYLAKEKFGWNPTSLA